MGCKTFSDVSFYVIFVFQAVQKKSSFKNSKIKIIILDEEEDYVYEYADYGEDYDEYYGEEAVDCSNYEASLKKLEDLEEKSCSEFAGDGYRCVPFFACNGGEIVTNGAG